MNAVAPNPLSNGFYTVGDATRFISGSTTRRIRGWLSGYRASGPSPLVARTHQEVGVPLSLSFLDLIEVRFVDHFRRLGVKFSTLKVAGERLRREFEVTRPFASDKVHVLSDKADVFIKLMSEVGRDEEDDRLVSLTTDNFVMPAIIEQALLPGIEFNRADHLARRWRPEPRLFDSIVIDPTVAYGRPAGPSKIPTESLRRAVVAEHGEVDVVARWFEVSTIEVESAVRFENLLDERSQRIRHDS